MAAIKPKKRQVKNPESFRDRALKSSASTPKKSRGHFKRFVLAIFRPLGSGLARLARSRALKPLRPLIRLLAKIFFVSYFVNSWRELKQVTWPSFKESRQLTFAVLAFAIVFGAVIAIVDYGFDKLFRDVLLK